MLPPAPRLALLDGLFGSQRALRKDLVPLVEPGLDGVDVVVQIDAQRREGTIRPFGAGARAPHQGSNAREALTASKREDLHDAPQP